MRLAMWLAASLLALGPLGATNARAAMINLGPGSFAPSAPVITFDEVPLGTVNPTFDFTGVPGPGNVTVSFAGHFVGQAAGAGPIFPQMVTLIDHTPTGPLALDPASPGTVTATDSAPGATSPGLSGSPTFNGPISVLFSVPVAGVGLKGGSFDTVNSTTIEAYDGNGAVLGRITNTTTGFELYGIADSGGASVIKGLSLFITGSELIGFQIDDVTFEAGDVVNPTPVPEPATLVLFGSGLAGLLAVARGRKRGSSPPT